MPAVPLARLDVEIVTVPDEDEAVPIVIEYVALAVCEALSVAVTVMPLKVPAAVGVPDMTPALLRVRPPGSVPVEDQV